MAADPVCAPRLWPDATVALLASGPSLVQSDVDLCRAHAKVIAINDAVQLAPWADVLYSSDIDWWNRVGGMPTFGGLKFAIERRRNYGRREYAWPDVTVLRNTGSAGLEDDPTGLRNYRNSGGAAINLAVHLGATRILLLGYDMRDDRGRQHFCDKGKSPGSSYQTFCERIGTLAPILPKRGVTVLNCSRRSALGCFPKVRLEDALSLACERVA